MVTIPIDGDTSVWILRGGFGRATVNVITRALVPHAHPQYQFLFKLGGSDITFRIGAQEYTLTADRAICLNPWVEHAKIGGGDKRSVVLSLLVEAPWLRKQLKLAEGGTPNLFPEAPVVLTPEVRHHVDRIAAALTNDLVSQDDDCGTSIINDLLIALGHDYIDPELTSDMRPSGRPIDFRIRKALDFMKHGAVTNPTVAQVAAQVGLSRSRFFEQFRRCMGISPQHYIDWVRMSKAIRLLDGSNKLLSDIAEELGFQEHSHFARFFAQHMGVPPSEFRKRAVTIDQDASADAHLLAVRHSCGVVA